MPRVSQAWHSFNCQRICCLFFWICCCYQHRLKQHPYNYHHINYERPALFPFCHFDSDACTQKKPHSSGGRLWGNGFYGFCLGGRTWRTMFWLITYHFGQVCQQKNAIKSPCQQMKVARAKFTNKSLGNQLMHIYVLGHCSGLPLTCFLLGLSQQQPIHRSVQI